LNAVGIEWIGLIAGLLTTGAFVPQVVKALRERQTAGVSMIMYVTLMIGNSLWLAYGVALGSPSLILANGVTLCLEAAVLCLKLRYG
jgi:MtN3 and saliva related transmembrane protein